VAAEKDSLREQGVLLTGHEEYADTIRRDLLAAVALRWRWWRLRAAPTRDQTARLMLARGLRREQRAWPPERNRPGQGLTPEGQRPRPSGTSDTEAGQMRVMSTDHVTVRPDRSTRELANLAWSRAHQVRRGRTTAVAVALVSVAVLALLSPRLVRHIPPRDVGPTSVPTGVALLPAYDKLSALPAAPGVSLAANLDIGTDQVPLVPTPLRAKPVPKVTALLQHAGGPVYAFAVDGTVRVIDNPELASPPAQLYSTSLSPDGQRAAFASAQGIDVLDVTTGKVREIDFGGPPGQLTWRDTRTLIVPNVSTALQVDVDSGTVGALATTDGNDVVTQLGKPTAPMLELIPANSSPKLRVWRTDPVITSDPVKAAPAVTDVEDRPIFGPPWIGRWTGPGFAEGDLVARACGPEIIPLPAKDGTARSAIGALGTNGLSIATLVGTDATTLDVIGLLDASTVLLNATGPKQSTLLAWTPQTGAVQRVSTVSQTVVISVAGITSGGAN
jgi:hypothetical protein